MKDLTEAHHFYDEAIRQAKHDAALYVERGQLRFEQRQLKKAASDFAEAMAIKNYIDDEDGALFKLLMVKASTLKADGDAGKRAACSTTSFT